MSMNDKHTGEPMTLEQVRAELNGAKGKRYWRSLDELARRLPIRNSPARSIWVTTLWLTTTFAPRKT
jgi:hypothetical protein